MEPRVRDAQIRRASRLRFAWASSIRCFLFFFLYFFCLVTYVLYWTYTLSFFVWKPVVFWFFDFFFFNLKKHTHTKLWCAPRTVKKLKNNTDELFKKKKKRYRTATRENTLKHTLSASSRSSSYLYTKRISNKRRETRRRKREYDGFTLSFA